jgi:hypothetical protein
MKSNHHMAVRIIIPLLLIVSSCAGQKENLQRGWIGGVYLEADPSWLKSVIQNHFEKGRGTVPALPVDVRKRQGSAILVSRIFENTPAAAGGLHEGDLILEVDHMKVEDLAAFQEAVDRLAPGASVPFSIYRSGNFSTQTVFIGRETYQMLHSFSLGLGLGTEFDPIPHPEFSLLDLIYFKTHVHRLELHSPEFQFFQEVRGQEDTKTGSNAAQEASWEGWDFKLVIFGFSSKHGILAQETLRP